MKLLTVTMQANDNYLVSGGTYGTANHDDSTWTRYLYDKNKLQNLKGYRCSGLPTSENPTLGPSVTDAQLQSALGVVEAKNPEGGKTKSGFDFRGTKRLTAEVSGNDVLLSPNQLAIGGCSAVINDSANTIKPRANLFSSDKTFASFVLVHGDEFNMYFLDGHVETANTDKAATKFIPDPDDTPGAVAVASKHIKKFED